MSMTIKELRILTGLSQTAFASAYSIPVSTLRKWEQGEAAPAPYIVRFLSQIIPGANTSNEEITDPDGGIYYFCPEQGRVYDAAGNFISINDDLTGVNRKNLGVYLQDLFNDFYHIRNRFEEDCKYDRIDHIEWI